MCAIKDPDLYSIPAGCYSHVQTKIESVKYYRF
jgi:hypothetical protein